jgi:nitroreductase
MLTLTTLLLIQIPEAEVRDILDISARAASGGNVQPWKVYVLGPEKRNELVTMVADKMASRKGEKPQYDIYPRGMEKSESPLNTPYMGRRRQLAYQMYDLMGVGDRADKVGRAQAMIRNFTFFDAPVGVLFTIDRGMGPPQVRAYLRALSTPRLVPTAAPMPASSYTRPTPCLIIITA